jgi:glycerol-3-phosphate acyltransferase PlsY
MVLAYLCGAVPIVYIVVRLLRGIDIRRYGTGNMGASNAVVQLGLPKGLLLGMVDAFGKGTLPIMLARLLGLGADIQVGIALAAVAGHNWSPYLKFTGGRGVATAMGAYVAFGLWQQLLFGLIVVGFVGWLMLRNLALWTVIGMTLVVPLAILLGQSREVVLLLLGLVALVMLKRLTGNWQPLATEAPRSRVMLNRLLYDRDVADRAAWIRRQSPGDPEGSG